MARTNRKEALAAASATSTVDALDDLNLDVMFEGGEDNFFDGLDIDLDGMGEIAEHGGGDKRGAAPDNVNAHGASDLDAMKFDLIGSNFTAPSASVRPPSQRKTKRKIKSLIHFDASEDEKPAKKKRRSTKSAASKKATPSNSRAVSGKKAAVASPSQPTVGPAGQKKSTGKNKGGLARQSSASSSVETETSKVKSVRSGPVAPIEALESSKDKKMRRVSSSTSQEMLLSESTFCGLHPSSTVFFPYMPALPPEPSIKRSSRAFSILGAVQSATSTQQSGKDHDISSPQMSPIPKTAPLFRLLQVDDQPILSPSDGGAVDPNQRQAAIGDSIRKARGLVLDADKTQLVTDLQYVSRLVKRQFDFLSQSLENMERWSRDNLGESDHASLYGVSTAGRKGRNSSDACLHLGVFRNPVIKVKINFNEYKDPKLGTLTAQLAPVAPLTKSSSSLSQPKREPTKVVKKRRASPASTEADKSAPTGTITPEDEVLMSYADLKPWQRRLRVAEMISRRAYQLDQEHSEKLDKRKKAIDKRQAELQKIVDDDQVHVSNTVALWKWIEKSCYFDDFLEEDVTEILQDLYEPEIMTDSVAVPHVVPPKHVLTSIGDVEGPSQTSDEAAMSMFCKLQSLLVDESEGIDDFDDEDSLVGFCGANLTDYADTDEKVQAHVVLDLSGLTREERLYIHLRSIGLAEDVPPANSDKYTLIEDSDTSTGTGYSTVVTESIEKNRKGNSVQHAYEVPKTNDMDCVIQAMQVTLGKAQRVNNERVAFLESAARAHLEANKVLRKREERDAMVISRYNQMLKRQKDTKRSSRQKTAKNDDDYLPW